MAFTHTIHRTTVIGAGQMGHGIAQVFALAGHPVMLHDVNEDLVRKGLDGIRKNLDTFVTNDLVTAAAADAACARIRGTTSLAEAAKDADLIEEAVFEQLSIKHELYARLEAVCRTDAIIASNTSGLMPTDLAAKMTHPERFIVAHFWKPAYLVRLVEVVPGQKTAPGLAEFTCEFLKSVKKAPVIVRVEAPGFIGNRLQHTLAREAAYMIERGIATPEDIDMAIMEGFGIRFTFAGICKIVDLMGLDLAANIASYLAADLAKHPGVPKVMAEKVAAGQLGAKTGKGYYDWPSGAEAEIKRIWDQTLIEQEKKRS